METYKLTAEKINEAIFSTFTSVYNVMTTLNPVAIESKDLNEFKSNYTTTMGLNGTIQVEDKNIEIRGSVIISWVMSSYLNMAGLIMGEQYTEYCSDIDDIGMEVLNTTIGNAKAKLNDLGIFIKMSLPTGFIGMEKIKESTKNLFSETRVFNTDGGKVCLMVNFLIDD